MTDFISKNTRISKQDTDVSPQKVQDFVKRTADLLQVAKNAKTGADVKEAVDNFVGKTPAETPTLKK